MPDFHTPLTLDNPPQTKEDQLLKRIMDMMEGYNQLFHQYQILSERLGMAIKFELKGPQGQSDPNLAIAYMIGDPNDLTVPAKRVWTVRGSGTVFLYPNGQFCIPSRLQAKKKFEADAGLGGTKIVERSDMPVFETLDDLFTAYDLFWSKIL